MTRMARFSLANAFDAFWDEHHKAVVQRYAAAAQETPVGDRRTEKSENLASVGH
jgi:hypothetical protein